MAIVWGIIWYPFMALLMDFSVSSPLTLSAFTNAMPPVGLLQRSIIRWSMSSGNSLNSWECRKKVRPSKSIGEAEYLATSTFHANDAVPSILLSIQAKKAYSSCCHSIWNSFEGKTITFPHVPPNLQLADICTKGLTKGINQLLVHRLMLLWNIIAIHEMVTVFCSQ